MLRPNVFISCIDEIVNIVWFPATMIPKTDSLERIVERSLYGLIVVILLHRIYIYMVDHSEDNHEMLLIL